MITVKAMVFPVVIYRCESWILKTIENQKIDAFKSWCWRWLWRVPWTAWRSDQSTPKGNQPWIFIWKTDTEVEAPIFVATWYKEQTHWKRPWCLERWKAKGEGGRREWDGLIAILKLNGHEFEQIPGDSEGQGCLVFCRPQVAKSNTT